METLSKSVKRLIRSEEFREALERVADDPSKSNGQTTEESAVVHVDSTKTVTIRRADLKD
jgi:hypothetical protein